MSSHGWPTAHTIPRKLYYNTIKTRTAGASYVGWALFGATTAVNEARHEVYNNILQSSGRAGGRDFYAYSGREIYDGNVYFDYQAQSPWSLLHVTGDAGQDVVLKDVITVTHLRQSKALADSMKYYPPGWESAGVSSIDPQLDTAYRPGAPACQNGAINLTGKGWPGTNSYENWRGAVKPT
jgi:hypothetical protein